MEHVFVLSGHKVRLLELINIIFNLEWANY